MSRKALVKALAIVCGTLPALAPVQAAAPPETVGAMLLRLQEESAAPLVQHCVARIPSLKRPLQDEYQKFRTRFRKATAPLRERIKASEVLSRPAPREVIKQFEEMDAQSLTQFKGGDPLSSCEKLKRNLASASAESIQKNMQSAFAQYTAAMRQGTPAR